MDAPDVSTQSPVIPVVVLEEHTVAHDLGQALLAGGIPVAEITFRTDAAQRSIEEMTRVDGMLVGAGTVTSPKQVDAAFDAGARFIVSPGLLPSVVERAREHDLQVIPGAVTPSEIMLALSLGLDLLKFFPANVYGGPAAITALGSPFRQVRFIPTGGVNRDNLGEYMALRNVAAVGGTWMVQPQLITARNFDEITNLSRRAVETADQARRDNR